MDESVLVVGSLAYDSVSSPAGSVKNELGGSATYGGISAAFHTNASKSGIVGIVGVVGDDFSSEDRKLLRNVGLDLTGLETVPGETFRWSGSYHGSMGEAKTHETHLNVLEDFDPKVPENWQNPTITFCANLHPLIQKKVLEQSPPSRLSMLDSMNLWIQIAKDDLLSVMKKVDLVIINDGEVRLLADDDNLVRAAHHVHSLIESTYLVVKRGEHGVLALHPDGVICIPAFPISKVIDPTGCGDTFAGTLASQLAKGEGPVTKHEMRKALEAATVTASFTLESFGTQSLLNLSENNFNQRLSQFYTIIHD